MPLTFNERLLRVISENGDTNCISTALYLTGVIPKDEFVNTNRTYDEYLSRLEISKEPLRGLLASWEWRFNKSVVHLGVITSLEPLCITSREGCSGLVFIDEPIEKFRKRYKGTEERFYIPPQNLFALDNHKIKIDRELCKNQHFGSRLILD